MIDSQCCKGEKPTAHGSCLRGLFTANKSSRDVHAFRSVGFNVRGRENGKPLNVG